MGEWHFIPWNIQYLVGGLLALVITILIFRRDPKDSSYKYFLAFGVCLAVWMFSVFITRNAPSLSVATATYRIVSSAFPLTMPLLLLTIISIGSRRRIYSLILIPNLSISLYILITAPFNVRWTNVGWAQMLLPEFVPIALSITIAYAAAIVIVLVVMIRKHKLVYLRRKYGFIMAGFLLYFIPLTVTNVMMWNARGIPPFGGILLVIEFIFIAYAMSLKSSNIEFTSSKPIGSLAETWLRFLQRVRGTLPGGELGQDAQKFDDITRALRLNGIVHLENGRQTIDAAQLAHLDMNETVDRTIGLMKKQGQALQALVEFTDVFTELYGVMKKESTEFASNWLNTMLRKHGGFLDKQEILNALPTGTKLPSILKELQSGKIYLFKEEKPVQAYGRLQEALEYGFIGLCFTKLEPQKVRVTYGVKNASLVRLTFQEKGMEEAVSPKDLEILRQIMSTSIVDSTRVVFVLDCLDQIIFANSFEKVKDLLKEIRKLCEENAANLLLSINAEMFKKEQMDSIEEVLSR